MKVVNIEICGVNDGDRVSATVIQERKRGDNWNRLKSWDVTSGMPEAKRKILLEDDERLVIEGREVEKIVFDKNQNAAVRVEKEDSVLQETKQPVDTRPPQTQPAQQTRPPNFNPPPGPTKVPQFTPPKAAPGGAASSKDIKKDT